MGIACVESEENGTSWRDGRSRRGPKTRGIWQRGGRPLCTRGGERGGCEMPFLMDAGVGSEVEEVEL